MSNVRRRFLCLILIGSLGAASRLQAQSAEPFSSLELSVSATADVGRDPLHRHWRPQPGVAVRVTTPFYLGLASLGVHRMPYTPVQPDQLDLGALTATLEWSAARRISGWFEGRAGVQVGHSTFKFHTQQERTFILEESELLSGLQVALLVGRVRGWNVSLSAAHQRLYTSTPIRLTVASISAGYSVTTPAWLRTILE